MATNAWQAFNSDNADDFLRSVESREQSARIKVVSLILDAHKKIGRNRDEVKPVLRVLEFGSGNGERLDLVLDAGIEVDWTGIDISSALVESARKRHPGQTWLVGDAEYPENVLGKSISVGFDVCLFCHVLEMLESPEMALKKAKVLARTTIVEFFEPPNGDVHRSAIGMLPESNLPYLRHTIGRETYLTWLANAEFKNLTIHKTKGKYEVHVLS
jgi:ubiquinone/menaquinone biosynthesis C-methylase UbiE